MCRACDKVKSTRGAIKLQEIIRTSTSLHHYRTAQHRNLPHRATRHGTAPVFLRSCSDPESVAPKGEPSNVISNTFDNQEQAREPLCASRPSQMERCRMSCQLVPSALRRLYQVSLCQSLTLSELFSFSLSQSGAHLLRNDCWCSYHHSHSRLSCHLYCTCLFVS